MPEASKGITYLKPDIGRSLFALLSSPSLLVCGVTPKLQTSPAIDCGQDIVDTKIYRQSALVTQTDEHLRKFTQYPSTNFSRSYESMENLGHSEP